MSGARQDQDNNELRSARKNQNADELRSFREDQDTNKLCGARKEQATDELHGDRPNTPMPPCGVKPRTPRLPVTLFCCHVELGTAIGREVVLKNKRALEIEQKLL